MAKLRCRCFVKSVFHLKTNTEALTDSSYTLSDLNLQKNLRCKELFAKFERGVFVKYGHLTDLDLSNMIITLFLLCF